MEKLKVLDLFSGIGGFSLGLERTGGFETVAFCEIEEFPRKVLNKHWPEIPIYKDVRLLNGEEIEAKHGRIDIITGGFPCQDISTTGKQSGIHDNTRSGLWSEIIRLCSELQPRYIIVENVANLLIGPSGKPGGWFSRVLGDLAAGGYDAQWDCIPASYFGAPHIRDRSWIIAYPNIQENHFCSFGRILKRHPVPRRNSESEWGGAMPRISRVGNGIPKKLVDRLGALGNAVVPQIPEMIGYAILESEKNHD